MNAQRWLGVVVLGACLFAGRVAAADDSRELAKQHFTAGQAKYNAGDYRGAITDFMAADALLPSPILSFNIALCHEKLGEKEAAVKLYRDYLARRPDAPNRTAVEGRISSLDAEIAAAAAAAPPAEAPPDGSEMPPDVLDNAEPPPAEAAPPPAEAPRRAYDDALARRVPGRTGTGSAPDGTIRPPAESTYPGAGSPPPPDSTPPPEPRRATPVYKQWWFWVVVGVSALIIIDVASGPDSSSGSQSTGAVLWRF